MKYFYENKLKINRNYRRIYFKLKYDNIITKKTHKGRYRNMLR